MAELVNELSWSQSRAATLAACPRRYWFSYYGSWGGWREDAPPRTREIYVLKQLASRWMWVGSVVHEAIERALRAMRRGEPVDEASSLDWALEKMRADFRGSRAGEYRDRPKQVLGLREHEYGPTLPGERWREVADHMKACLSAFWRSPYSARLAALPPASWLPVEELASFALDGVKVFVRLDLAYRPDESTVEIVDWKTGRRDGGGDSLQLACYALFALAEGWVGHPSRVVTVEYNLATGNARERRVSDSTLDGVREHIRESVAAMRALLDDPATNRASEQRFPVAEDARECGWCSYRRVCDDSPLPRSGGADEG